MTYFGFDKYDSGSTAKNGFQIAQAWSDARMGGTFDTLQLYQDGRPKVFFPKWDGINHPTILEAFASAYPEYVKVVLCSYMQMDRLSI